MRVLAALALVAVSLIGCGSDEEGGSSAEESRLDYVHERCDTDGAGEFSNGVMRLDRGNALQTYFCVQQHLDLADEPWDSSTQETGSYSENGLDISWERQYIGYSRDPSRETTYPILEIRDPESLTITEHEAAYRD